MPPDSTIKATSEPLTTPPEGDGSLPLTTTQHFGSSRQYWRDIILGVNDGLVSTFLLVAGVTEGGFSSIDILLTAIAGALARSCQCVQEKWCKDT